MTPGAPDKRPDQSLASSFDRYLQDKGKGRGGDGGNYRRNAARKLKGFAEWAAGDHGDDDWAGITPKDTDRDPIFDHSDFRTSNGY